jgi:hypothetical protein
MDIVVFSEAMSGFVRFPLDVLLVTQRIETRSCTLRGSSSLCGMGAVEFALVSDKSRLLLGFPLSFELLQRLPPLRVLALFFRRRL